MNKVIRIPALVLLVTIISAVSSSSILSNITFAQSVSDQGSNVLPLETDNWWKWALSLDTQKVAQSHPGTDGNPFTDKTGALCDVGLQENGIFYLLGTAGVFTPEGQIIQKDTSYQRHCNIEIKQGTSLLIPILNTECSNKEYGLSGPCGKSPEELRASAKQIMDNADTTSLNLVIDNTPYTFQRVTSTQNGFSAVIPVNNAFGITSSVLVNNPELPTGVHGMADGYWALINNLSPGQHTITFGGDLVFPGSGTFSTEVTYYLTISPSSSTTNLSPDTTNEGNMIGSLMDNSMKSFEGLNGLMNR